MAAQLTRLNRKLESAEAERRRLVDRFQNGLIKLVELRQRAKELDARRKAIEDQRLTLIEPRRLRQNHAVSRRR